MTYCAVKGCHNASHKHENDSKITFHAFPVNPFIASQWVKKLRLNRKEEHWKPTKHTKICSEHFKDKERFKTKGGNWKLHKSAVPTKGLHIDCTEKRKTKHKGTKIKLEESEISESNLEDKDSVNNDSSDSQNSSTKPLCKEDSCSSSQPDLISEDSEDYPLKKGSKSDKAQIAKLKKQISLKASLQIKHAKEIKVLNQRTRRLQKKYASLKKVFKELQKK